MNAGAGARVSPAMSSRDPKVEATVERMYSAMRAVINNAPLVVTGLAIGACAGAPLMPVEIVMSIGFATFKPEATSVIWAGKVISTGDADLSLQMEDPVHELSVFNFEDSMGRVRKQSGKGRLWLALDDATAERLGHYRGAGIDGPVSLTLLWPSSDTMRFEVRLHGDALDDDEGMPKTRAGAGKAWHGYKIEVCPYPGPAADLFQTRNRP